MMFKKDKGFFDCVLQANRFFKSACNNFCNTDKYQYIAYSKRY